MGDDLGSAWAPNPSSEVRFLGRPLKPGSHLPTNALAKRTVPASRSARGEGAATTGPQRTWYVRTGSAAATHGSRRASAGTIRFTVRSPIGRGTRLRPGPVRVRIPPYRPELGERRRRAPRSPKVSPRARPMVGSNLPPNPTQPSGRGFESLHVCLTNETCSSVVER